MPKEYPLLRDFFRGKTIALTGGTGFIGQGVIEKLLRCCPDVKKIILLIRNKRDKSPQERLEALTQLPVFTLLREQEPNFAEKLQFISCDLEAPDLGLSEDSIRILRQDCEIFFHSAATVRFNEHLRLAFEINVQCTRKLLKVFKRNRNKLQAFIHVSTAYSQTDRVEVDEKLYPCSINYKDLESSLRWMTDDMITQLTPEMLGKRPNTYTLTKAMAEDAIAREGNHLPVCIVRPSMIIPAYKEPIPGWCTNMYGPTAFLVAYSMGVVRALIADTNTVADLIPIDFVVNGVLAAAMKTASDNDERRSSLGYHSDSGGSFEEGYEDSSSASSSGDDDPPKRPTEDLPSNKHEIPIYLINSSTVNPTTLGDQAEYAYHYYDIFPAKAIRTPSLYITENRLLYSAVSFTTQTIPAYAIDACRMLVGKKRKMIDINTRIRKSVDVIEFFFTNSFKFGIEKQQELFHSLQPEDQKTYSLDLRVIDWRKYGETYARGCNRFLLKVDEEKYEENKKNLQRLKMLDKCVYSASALGMAGLAVATGFTDSLWELTGVISENLGISVLG